METKERKIVTRNIEVYDASLINYKGGDIHCSIDAMITYLNSMKEKLKDKKNVVIQDMYGGEESQDRFHELVLSYDDLETDKEFETRIQKEQKEQEDSKMKAKQLEYENELRELNKKYGKI